MAMLAGCLAGACIAFLWFNAFPATIFMGDTGSLGLGGAIAALAIMTNTEVLLILIGGIFVIEALSVLIQVISFRMIRRRVFLMAPIHHHFELKAWSETKIMLRFWIVASLSQRSGSRSTAPAAGSRASLKACGAACRSEQGCQQRQQAGPERSEPRPGSSRPRPRPGNGAQTLEHRVLLTATMCLLAFGAVMVYSASSATSAAAGRRLRQHVPDQVHHLRRDRARGDADPRARRRRESPQHHRAAAVRLARARAGGAHPPRRRLGRTARGAGSARASCSSSPPSWSSSRSCCTPRRCSRSAQGV